MKFDYKFDEIKEEIEKLKIKADKLAAAYAEAEDFTENFLKKCYEHGVELVSIGIRTNLIKGCQEFPFSCDNSVFAEKRDITGIPAIWFVVEELNISGGAGNDCQHQINQFAQSKLIDGIYEFKDKKWYKIK